MQSPQMTPPSLRRASTQDFDEQAGLLQGWNQHYAQLSSGRFRGNIIEARFEDVHLFAESTSHALYQSGKLADGMVAVGIPLRAPTHGLFCGAAMQNDAVHLFSGDDGFEFYSPARLTMGGIVVPRAALQAWLEQGGELSASNRARLKAVPQSVMREARAFLFAAFDLCNQHPALLESANFRRQLRAAALACVADLLGDHDRRHEALTPQRRAHIVQQARAYLQGGHEAPPDVEDICRETGVSRRTLQYCFQDIVGMNPAAFLRAHRLNGVRRLLKDAHSVTEAATAWGFWHFGHFSQEYKKLFSELPSDTLHRNG